jgi:hypothetical protein
VIVNMHGRRTIKTIEYCFVKRVLEIIRVSAINNGIDIY